jgi:4-oxalocrotonate tautomerase
MVEGRTDEQKRALFEQVTDAVHRTLGAPRENVRIMIHEVPPRHFATGGIPKSGPSGAKSGGER